MTPGCYRLAKGGRIDRTAALRFCLDGKFLSGFTGDSLASALLADGVTLVGRSFKYHRPRGFLSAGVEEPNGLFTLGEDGRTEPNVAGTSTELFAGLVARRQNCWPSAAFDLMAINSWIAPLLVSGFYYKTFMGPTRRSWMFYERFIRRAAGLGRAVHQRDPDRYETRHAFTDVLVIGAGPAGLTSALTAARAGARVLIVEQDWLLGGSLLREGVEGPAETWLRQIEAELASLSNVEILRRTTALGVYDANTVALVERRDHLQPNGAAGEPRQITITVRADAIIYATGAAERPLIFANNDRPGVMLASAARTYLNRFAVILGKRALVATNNDSAYATAFDLAQHGVSVTIADQRGEVQRDLQQQARDLEIELLPDTAVVDVLGGKRVRQVILSSPSEGSPSTRRECDLLCMSGGWSPVVHLTSHGGIKPRYVPEIAGFVPGGYAEGHFGVGALTGSVTLAEAVKHGVDVGRSAAAQVGCEVATIALSPPSIRSADHAVAVLGTPRTPQKQTDKAFVDFQNDVTVKDITVAHQEGYESVEHLKRYTTLGMGTDQGKTSNINALAIEARLRGLEIPAVGTTTFRPPYTPVSFGALAGRSVGKHFRPTRRSPLHDWHLAHGAAFTEAGPWLRAWWYRWAGPTVEQAYLEEMRLVRSAVGLSDASTLGKIDIQGPDATELLNRIYVNDFARLPVGKTRYGVMLADDGTVFDDGSTTRLDETRYFMTTTTAHAAEVLSWMEFLLQTAWTDLKVHVTSVTDVWAAMAIAGPKARAALELALPGHDLSNVRLPYMGCMEIEYAGVSLRLIRLSFSGELAYELYVPAEYAVALWEHILSSAAPLGIKPVGLETVASLRVEKGHVAGLELDHRNTLKDLGLGRMGSTGKAYVGRELSQRPALQAQERWSLVGIECLEPGRPLRGGSILFGSDDKIEGHGRGYITSVTWSTERKNFIALALYQGGLKHTGEEIICAYPLRGEQVRGRIVSPVFLDPKGERLRA
jgi:heterotetrameric sarcosine oxidase alpha subunit